MACNTPDCSDANIAGTGQFVTNVPQRTCSGETFCDSNLEGLPFANQIDLVGVPEGDQCLNRINAAKGIWQHDPDRPGGSDYVGPLSAGLNFVPGTNVGEDECGFVPTLRSNSDGSVELVKQDVVERSDGELSVVNTCSGGTQRTDILDPEDFDTDNPCEANISILGWVNQAVIVNGRNTLRKVWKQLTKLLFPATQLTSFTDSDYTDGDHWRRAAWKKNGTCWELGLDEADEAVSDSCADLPSAGTQFPYLFACKDGVQNKVEPTAGMTLVGDGSNWNLRATGGTILNPRVLVGQNRAGFTSTRGGTISSLVDDPTATTGQTTGTYDMTAISGYVAGSNMAKVRCAVEVNSVAPGAYPVAQVKINDMIAAEASMTSNSTFAMGYAVYVDVKLTNDTFTFDLRAAVSSGNGQAWSKLEIVGFE